MGGSAVNLFLKYFLFFFNFAVWLVCGVVVGLTIWVLDQKETAVDSVSDFFLDPACVMCLASSLGFAIAFFGWFGALRENTFCLKMYRYVLMVFLVLELVLVILIFVLVYVPDSRQQLGIYPEDSLNDAIVKYRDDPDLQNLIDGLQEWWECCGTSNDDEGYKDWSKNMYFNCSTGKNDRGIGEFCSVPFSCCIKTDDGLINYKCGENMQSTEKDNVRSQSINTRGCFKAISTIMQDNVLVVGGVIIGILIPQILLSGLAGRLIEQIKIQIMKLERSMRVSAAMAQR